MTDSLSLSCVTKIADIDPYSDADRLRERFHRYRYARERDAFVDVDGVPWPVDLGESGA